VLFFATNFLQYLGGKGIKMLVSIIIIKLILIKIDINLISWYYYFCST